METESNSGRSTDSTYDRDERLAYMLLLEFGGCYNKLLGQTYGPSTISIELLRNTPAFKTFVTAAKKLSGWGLEITHKQVTWKGYVQYVFEQMRVQIGMPSPYHLCNEGLFRRYMRRDSLAETVVVPQRSRNDLAELYSKILLPEIKQAFLLQLVR